MKSRHYIFYFWGLMNFPGILTLLVYLYTGVALGHESRLSVMLLTLFITTGLGAIALVVAEEFEL